MQSAPNSIQSLSILILEIATQQGMTLSRLGTRVKGQASVDPLAPGSDNLLPLVLEGLISRTSWWLDAND